VKYWRWINEQAGEWYRTGLMTKDVAEKVAESFRQSHEQVESEVILKPETGNLKNEIGVKCGVNYE
jgi:hypothetical protein